MDSDASFPPSTAVAAFRLNICCLGASVLCCLGASVLCCHSVLPFGSASFPFHTKEKHWDDYNQREDEALRTSVIMPYVDVNATDEEIYLRADHEEGIWTDEHVPFLVKKNSTRSSKRKRTNE